MLSMATRGRPKLHEDKDILASVVGVFARSGYEAVSMRSLSLSLGLSHSALGQRFGSKEELYRTAVDAEFKRFIEEVGRSRDAHPSDLGDLGDLRTVVHSFLSTSALFPALGQLMNQEGSEASSRLEHILETVVRPQLQQITGLVERLIEAKVIHPVTTRALFFLMAHGAEAPFTLTALSSVFDDRDGVLNVAHHVDATTDLLIRGLVRDPAHLVALESLSTSDQPSS